MLAASASAPPSEVRMSARRPSGRLKQPALMEPGFGILARTIYFDAESFARSAKASCTVVMNCAGKIMVEFFSIEISAIV
jgi:hypothetical protein